MSLLESNVTGLLLKATLILIVVLAAHFALRRASAATRHLSLTMAMLGLVLLPFLSLSLPVWQLEVLPQSPPGSPNAAAKPPPQLDEEWQAGKASPGASPPVELEGRDVAATVGKKGLRLGLVGWLFVAWALGASVVLAKLTAGLSRMRWILRNGRRVTDPDVMRMLDECVNRLDLQIRPLLLTSSKAGVPLVWGWLRPALIVPCEFTGWTPDRMHAVMLHELAHLKRHDWPVLLLGRVVASLYWFHPLAWFVERAAKQECERACDDIVVSYGTKPSEYASHLLSIARGVSETPASVRAALAVVRRSQLNSRLRSILNPILRRNAPSRTAVTGLATALLLVLLPLASLQFAEQARADEPQDEGEWQVAQNKRHEMHDDDDSESSEGERAYEKGYKLHSKGQYAQAADAFEEAMDLGFRPGTSMYNIACCHALMGEAGRAMSWLEKAFDAGFDDPGNLTSDSDFHPIRSDAAFQAFIDEAFEKGGLEREFPDDYPYRAAMEQFQKLKDSGSTEGKKWHHVGYELIGMGEYDMAIDAFNVAAENMGEQSSTAMYNLACSYSLAGKTGTALEWLDRAVEAGFDQHERFLNDSDLDNIRNESEFARIQEKSEFLSLGRFPQRDWDESDYSADRWAPAVQEFQDYVRRNPASGRAWFSLGYALHFSSRHDEAVGAFEKAASLGFRTSTATYNVACANAMLNRTDAAMAALETAVDSGNIHYGQLEGDDDLDNLREDPRFQALLDKLEAEQEHEHADKMRMKLEKKMQMKLEKGEYKLRRELHDDDDD